MARGNILIVDPNQLFREGLRQLLLKARFTVSGDGKDLAAAIANSTTGKAADLVILTLEPGESLEAGLVQIEQIRQSLPSTKLVVLAASLSSAEFLQAMRAGVDAVLTNNISTGVLQASLELVMQSQQIFLAPMSHLLAVVAVEPDVKAMPGELGDARQEERQGADAVSNLVPFTPLRPVAMASVPCALAARSAPAALPERSNIVPLSEREGQILRYLVKGYSNKAIARELTIAETTVKVHVKGLMRKVRAANRTQVAIWAMNHYFTPEEVAAQGPGSTIGLGVRIGISSSIIVGSSDQSRSA